MSFKTFLFRIAGKDPEAVVVSFLSGPPHLARPMLEEVMKLVPDRRHYAVTIDPPLDVPEVTFVGPGELPASLRIGLAPMLLGGPDEYSGLRRLAWKLAPSKILAYNARLERHHLHPRSPIASWLFWRGVPLDRIFLRPKWLMPWKGDRSVYAEHVQTYAGRPAAEGRKHAAVVSPYFPYPLSHGGAVRIFNLLARAARRYEIHLFAFLEDQTPEDIQVMQQFCFRLYLVPKTRYREPRWSTFAPPEVREFESKPLARALGEARREYPIRVVQAEYTQMAVYRPDILVEHDVTFDLHRQSRSSWWELWRWVRFEKRAIARARRVVVMSEKDAVLAGAGERARVIPNGVDLARFQAHPEQPGAVVLFVGSFRHEPNRTAYSMLVSEIWPIVKESLPSASLIVVAGPTPEIFWPDAPAPVPGEVRHAFVADVRPLYRESNVVVVPTKQSAGTNLKVIEAMAMGRAVVSTSTGCAGLGLTHDEDVWIEDEPAAFGRAVVRLLSNPGERSRLAANARRLAEERYDWDRIAELQVALWNELS